jgi:hypothetical protein
MDFTSDFWLFCINFINVSFWFVQIFTLLNVALSKTSFQSIFGNKLCLIHSPSPRSICSVYNRQAGRVQNIFGTSLFCNTIFNNPRSTFLCTYNVHCSTFILGPSFSIFFKSFCWTQGRKENHRLDPVDLKIHTLAKKRDCDSTADKIHRFSPKLALRLPSLVILEWRGLFHAIFMGLAGVLWGGGGRGCIGKAAKPMHGYFAREEKILNISGVSYLHFSLLFLSNLVIKTLDH